MSEVTDVSDWTSLPPSTSAPSALHPAFPDLILPTLSARAELWGLHDQVAALADELGRVTAEYGMGSDTVPLAVPLAVPVGATATDELLGIQRRVAVEVGELQAKTSELRVSRIEYLDQKDRRHRYWNVAASLSVFVASVVGIVLIQVLR